MKWLSRQVVVFVLSSIALFRLVGGQKFEEKNLKRCASFLTASGRSGEGGGEASSSLCEACVENQCGWNSRIGRCVPSCDDDDDDACYSLQQQQQDHHPSDYYNILLICTKFKSIQHKTKELDTSLSPSSALGLEEDDKGIEKVLVRRETLETNSENNTTTSTSTTANNDDKEEELSLSTFCREITECISCYGNPPCTWYNGTCFSEMAASSGSDNSATTTNKNRTVSAEVFCTSNTNYDDDLLQIFNDVVAAVEKAKEEDEMMEEEEGGEDSVGVDATAGEYTNEEDDDEQPSGGVVTPGTVTVAATGTAGTVTVTSAAAASTTITMTNQLGFLGTAFLVVASHF